MADCERSIRADSRNDGVLTGEVPIGHTDRQNDHLLVQCHTAFRTGRASAANDIGMHRADKTLRQLMCGLEQFRAGRFLKLLELLVGRLH